MCLDNLCSERTYDAAKFEQRVRRFPMDDHNPCAFEQLIEICANMAAELDEHPQNVVCVHCKVCILSSFPIQVPHHQLYTKTIFSNMFASVLRPFIS